MALARSALSRTTTASSNGRAREQSITVCTAVVTQIPFAPAPGAHRSRASRRRRRNRTCVPLALPRPRGTLTSTVRAGSTNIPQPRRAAAVRPLAVALSPSAYQAASTRMTYAGAGPASVVTKRGGSGSGALPYTSSQAQALSLPNRPGQGRPSDSGPEQLLHGDETEARRVQPLQRRQHVHLYNVPRTGQARLTLWTITLLPPVRSEGSSGGPR